MHGFASGLAKNDYNTDLGPMEQVYQMWVASNLIPFADQDYDMRGFYQNALANDPKSLVRTNGQHYTDQFKKPSHPTFSQESAYSTPETPGGQWAELPDGKWTFRPTVHNMENMGGFGNLVKYLQKREVDPQGNRMAYSIFEGPNNAR